MFFQAKNKKCCTVLVKGEKKREGSPKKEVDKKLGQKKLARPSGDNRGTGGLKSKCVRGDRGPHSSGGGGRKGNFKRKRGGTNSSMVEY